MITRRMITVLILLLVLAMASTGSLAATAPVRATPSNAAVADPFPETAEWRQMQTTAKSYLTQMRENEKAMQRLNKDLSTEVDAARTRIKILLSAPITAEQLTLVKSQMAELKGIVEMTKADVGRLGHEMTVLRGRQTDLDLEGMISCFDDAIAIQEGRKAMVTDAVELVKALAIKK